MRQILGLLILGSALIPTIAVAQAQFPSLKIAYPSTNHQTIYDRIFFVGTAPAAGQVLVNGKVVKRSPIGHFAPSFPLQLGENVFNIRYQNQDVQIKVVRTANQPVVPKGLAFAKDSLTPVVDVAKLGGEPTCFSAVAAPNSIVNVKLANQIIPLLAQPPQTILPGSLDEFTGRNQPITLSGITKYEGCKSIAAAEQNLE